RPPRPGRAARSAQAWNAAWQIGAAPGGGTAAAGSEAGQGDLAAQRLEGLAAGGVRAVAQADGLPLEGDEDVVGVEGRRPHPGVGIAGVAAAAAQVERPRRD